jgi:hypothetical protein
MQYKNISNRTIRVVNVILKPNEVASFPENSAHVKTFLRMNWLTAIEEERKPAVVEAPPVVEEVTTTEVAPEVAPEEDHKRGRGRKGK